MARVVTIKQVYEKIEQQPKPERLAYACREHTSIPLRLRLCLYSLSCQCSVAQADRLLRSQGCEALYPRNVYDVTFLYALHEKKGFSQWLRYALVVRDWLASLEGTVDFQDMDISIFNEGSKQGKCSLHALESYCAFFEKTDATGQICADQYTRLLTDKLSKIHGGETVFQAFFQDNMTYFIQCRQRGRRLFMHRVWMYLTFCLEQDDQKSLPTKGWYRYAPVYQYAQLSQKGNLFVHHSKEEHHINIQELVWRMNAYYQNWMLVKTSMLEATLDEDTLIQKDYTSRAHKAFSDYLRNILFGRTDVTRSFYIMFAVFASQVTDNHLRLGTLNQELTALGFGRINENDQWGLDGYAVMALGATGEEDWGALSQHLNVCLRRCVHTHQENFLYEARRPGNTGFVQDSIPRLLEILVEKEGDL